MELVRGLHNISAKHHGCVLSIGKFDGVHLGHQAVLKKLVKQAEAMHLPACVMIFEPQPEEVFSPEQAPARLSMLRDKFQHFARLGIDRLLCIRFDRNFANFSAEYFVEHLLVQQLGVKYLVVGDDFRFGKARSGDYALLSAKGDAQGFEVATTESFCLQASRISSTLIREALAASDFLQAELMLGYPYAISGKVVHGEKRGRTIGFPTANLLLKQIKMPVSGVFAVRIAIEGQPLLDGVANIGTRPTVMGLRSQLEVHIFDFTQNLYGQRISVQLKAKLRDEQKFASIEELKQQIMQDAEQARVCLAKQQ